MEQYSYYMSRINLLSDMNFYGLSDFQLIWETETCKQEIISKMTNNGFIDFIKKSQAHASNEFNLYFFIYYDMD